jgi:hypothetical protein
MAVGECDATGYDLRTRRQGLRSSCDSDVKRLEGSHFHRGHPGKRLHLFGRLRSLSRCSDRRSAGRFGDLSFEWPLDDKLIPLQAIYPDSYPFLRPHIYVTNPAFFPKRHYSPIDGNLCLLGRDSRQWSSSWTVPELLRNQLRDAFENAADEDPQGESAEVWWNNFGRPGSYCLIDSSWSLLSASSPGKLKLSYVAKVDSAGYVGPMEHRASSGHKWLAIYCPNVGNESECASQ